MAKPIYTADLCDAHLDARILAVPFRDYAARAHFHGQAVTFSTFEDNGGIRKIIAEGGKGKVLVVDGQGSLRRALCGGNIGAEAEEHGWEGLIFFGAVRDQHEMADLKLGMKALGTAPMRPFTTGIGRRDVELSIGGARITPGDWVYADPDGVIVGDKQLHKG